MNNVDLFDKPLRSRKVRNNIYAHQYRNGVININGQKYLEYSLSEAIKLFREQFPFKK